MFDFIEGEKTASNLEGGICTKINDIISQLFREDFADVYRQYPWKNLADFVLEETEKTKEIMGEEMSAKLQDRIAAAGFTIFSRMTIQSQNAEQIAKKIDERIRNSTEYFRDYQIYVAQIIQKTPGKAQFNGQEVALFAAKVQKRRADLWAAYQGDKNRVLNAMNDNNFLCPIVKITDIWYMVTLGMFDRLLQDLTSKFGPTAMQLIKEGSAGAE